MNYINDYITFLKERERLRAANLDVEPLNQELLKQVDKLSADEKKKFMQKMFEIDKHIDEKNKVELEQILSKTS